MSTTLASSQLGASGSRLEDLTPGIGTAALDYKSACIWGDHAALNTRTMHRALPYAHDSGRLMHRTKLEGEEAFA